jgi:hypothetical protein
MLIAREVNEASRCSHPIRLKSTQVNIVTGEVTSRIIKVACKDRREVVCPACSRVYGTDAWIVAATGINGGKGVSSDVIDRPRIFVTMTAPSFGSVHTIRSDGTCVRASSGDCEHGVARSCNHRHDEVDQLLGSPICDRCFQYSEAVLWNAHASRLWSATILQARRNLASKIGVRRADISRHAAIHYLKVAEMQRRGLVHFHTLARLETQDTLNPSEYEGELISAWADAVRSVGISNDFGRFEWGAVLDIKRLGKQSEDARVLASYLAKYVTKTAGDGLELARRFRTRRQIKILVDNPHLKRMALQSWDLGMAPECFHLKLRTHANTLGFTGQLMTKSRGYSTTLTALRQARSDFRNENSSNEFVASGYSYEGRGYNDPRTAVLAELLVNLEREQREVCRNRSHDA